MSTLQNNYGLLEDRAAAAGETMVDQRAPEILTKASGDVHVQTDVITVDTAVASTAYTYTFEGETVTITSDASPTVEEIAAALATQHNSQVFPSGDLAGQSLASVAPAVPSGATVTLYGRNAEQTFTTSESDANLSLASNANSLGEALVFGMGVSVVPGMPKSAEPMASGEHFVGFVKRFQRVNTDTTIGQAIELGRARDIVTSGLGWVLLDAGQDPQPGDSVYVRHTTVGSDLQGNFRSTADANADVLPAGRAEWIGEMVELDIDKKRIGLIRLV